MCVCTTDLTEEALTTLLPIEHHDHFLNNSSTPYLLYWFSVEGHVQIQTSSYSTTVGV